MTPVVSGMVSGITFFSPSFGQWQPTLTDHDPNPPITLLDSVPAIPQPGEGVIVISGEAPTLDLTGIVVAMPGVGTVVINGAAPLAGLVILSDQGTIVINGAAPTLIDTSQSKSRFFLAS